jgi:hypothetical protein
MVRVACLFVTLLTLALFIATLPIQFDYLRTPCPETPCLDDGRLTPENLQALQALGFSADFYAAGIIAFDILFAAVYLLIAAMIFIRKSDDGLALFVALMLVTFGIATFSDSFEHLATHLLTWRLPLHFVRFIGDIAIIIFLFIFPDGRFVPRWTRLLALIWTLTRAPVYFFPHSSLNPETWPALYDGLLFLAVLGAGLLAQLYRYRYVSNSSQRQQTKWVVFGLMVAGSGYLGLVSLVVFAPSLEQTLEQNFFIRLAVYSAAYLFILLIPISIGIAILRSRLWDIDILINRTLVYGLLTLSLAFIYFASVVIFQAFFRVVTEQNSQVAIVISTLVIAALFAPWRRVVQNFIDRRFYRRRYDAAKALAGFSATARDEVDLEILTAELLRMVEETIQPAHVSLWLRGSGKSNVP